MPGRLFIVGVMVLLVSAISGCPSGPPRPKGQLPTFKLTGQVHVDGNPVPGITIYAVPAAKLEDKLVGPANVPSNHIGATDKDGKFAMTTYDTGDGVPAGDYVLVFYWAGPPTVIRTSQEEDDGAPPSDPTAAKLIARYGNPAKSEIKVTVEDGKPRDMGLIELKTK